MICILFFIHCNHLLLRQVLSNHTLTVLIRLWLLWESCCGSKAMLKPRTRDSKVFKGASLDPGVEFGFCWSLSSQCFIEYNSYPATPLLGPTSAKLHCEGGKTLYKRRQSAASVVGGCFCVKPVRTSISSSCSSISSRWMFLCKTCAVLGPHHFISHTANSWIANTRWDLQKRHQTTPLNLCFSFHS